MYKIMNKCMYFLIRVNPNRHGGGGHANSSCCEAAVLTAAPPFHTVIRNSSDFFFFFLKHDHVGGAIRAQASHVAPSLISGLQRIESSPRQSGKCQDKVNVNY